MCLSASLSAADLRLLAPEGDGAAERDPEQAAVLPEALPAEEAAARDEESLFLFTIASPGARVPLLTSQR
jgi:hypothetical protein